MLELMKQSTGKRIFLFLIILLISSLIGVTISFAFMFAGDMETKISQGISSLFMFVVPPIVYYCLTRKKRPMRAIGLRRISPFWILFVGIVLMFVSLPVTNQLTLWNEGMDLGAAFQQLEDYLKAFEETAKSATARSDAFGAGAYSTVTLEVTPREAEMLVFAEQIKGRISLALRNRNDTYYEKELPQVNFAKIREEIELLNQKRQNELNRGL